MKRLVYIASVVVLCGLSLSLGNHVSKAYTNKTARGYYDTSSVSGVASIGPNIISGMGIGFTTYSPIADPSVYIVKHAMNYMEVTFFHCHGNAGLIAPQYGGPSITGTTVSSWIPGCLSSRLVYLSSCKTGTVSSTYGDFPALLTQKGVGTVVSFKDTITATTSTDGIHRYNELAVTNMVYGYPLYLSMSMAQTTFIAERNAAGYSTYCGADSYRITGYGNYMIVHS